MSPRPVVDRAVMAVTCPRCGAGPRRRCHGPLGDRTTTHKARIDASAVPEPAGQDAEH